MQNVDELSFVRCFVVFIDDKFATCTPDSTLHSAVVSRLVDVALSVQCNIPIRRWWNWTEGRNFSGTRTRGWLCETWKLKADNLFLNGFNFIIIFGEFGSVAPNQPISLQLKRIYGIFKTNNEGSFDSIIKLKNDIQIRTCSMQLKSNKLCLTFFDPSESKHANELSMTNFLFILKFSFDSFTISLIGRLIQFDLRN